jgi:hypothetical protein
MRKIIDESKPKRAVMPLPSELKALKQRQEMRESIKRDQDGVVRCKTRSGTRRGQSYEKAQRMHDSQAANIDRRAS